MISANAVRLPEQSKLLVLFQLLFEYAYSFSLLPIQRRIFKDIKTTFFFIGYQRSGHSIIGSFLDAHPNIVCSHELHFMRYVLAGFSLPQIYSLIIANSRRRRGRRISGHYSYDVPSQWQGKFRHLIAVGDKQGEGTTLAFGRRPWLLDRLLKLSPSPKKFLHIVRNPFDNIATIARRNNITLEQAADYYFSLCTTNQELIRRIPKADYLEIRHEEFVRDTTANLTAICRYLDVDAEPGYLNDCAKLVYASPHKSRLAAPWSRELKKLVEYRLESFSFLLGYVFSPDE
jgi:hypothetical protein